MRCISDRLSTNQYLPFFCVEYHGVKMAYLGPCSDRKRRRNSPRLEGQRTAGFRQPSGPPDTFQRRVGRQLGRRRRKCRGNRPSRPCGIYITCNSHRYLSHRICCQNLFLCHPLLAWEGAILQPWFDDLLTYYRFKTK